MRLSSFLLTAALLNPCFGFSPFGIGTGTTRAQNPQGGTVTPTSTTTISTTATPTVSAAPTAGINPATAAAPRNPWLAQTEGLTARAAKGGIEVLFVGDSITEGWKNGGRAVWAERYEPIKAANFGIGGDRTEHVLWRLQNGNLQGISPKVVVLMIGTNNTGRDEAPQIAEGVTAVVSEIRARCPESKILLLAVFPRGEKPGTAIRAKVDAINQKIATLDDGGVHISYLDIGPKLLQDDGSYSHEVSTDFTHLTAAGYEKWANAMDERLKQLLGK